MNESLFFLHSIVLVGIVIFALKLGKEALITTFCVLALLANLLVTKQIEFFGWTITCSDAYEIASFISLAYINKYYGEKLAKKAIWVCFFILLLFSVSSITHLLYRPSDHDTMHNAYKSILGHTPRIFISSILAYFISQKLCLVLQKSFSKLRKFPKTLQISAAIAISQFIDTITFSFLALFGLMYNIVHIILMSFAVKLLCIIAMTPFVRFSNKIIKEPSKVS